MNVERELADFRYYAVFKNGVGGMDRASMLVRRPEGYREESYVGYGLWVHTDKLYRLDSGRDWTDDYSAITEAEALELRSLIDESCATHWHHHVISADGTPFAVVLTAKNRDWGRRPQEISRYGYHGRSETDLLDRVSAEPTWSVEVVEPAAAGEVLARIEQRRRDRSGLTGGYAVFRTLIDVLDLDSACAVVPEPGEQHEFTVRLDTSEAERLTDLLRLRNAKRQAAAVGAHQYFGLFNNVGEAGDTRNAYSVIRSTVDASPQRWEVFVRPGQWLPAVRPSSQQTLLPLGDADLAAVTARLAAGESRYLAVRCRDRGPVALLRLTGTTEESARDLGWEPSDVLTRLPGEQSWFVGEVDEESMAGHRFWSAHLSRAVKFRGQEYEYFAIFPTREAAFDLSRARLVIRRRAEIEEKFSGPAGWVPTGPQEQINKAYYSRYLPISHDEVERLIS
ncbi:hypothetical protein SK803_09915 [Lentzea sp. BCCO 10_0856]|uniref:Uncharacterized protein n=1 Tax=Lentzea miocenica TaxID=3095431 RepID=A0ABU4SX88_9PSEU|nr:hypothetical protein [Lentzea sp. BCCO 10_0856]MDX8030528.1 hypothetical protein [Lentzea sp. BCCO 10_0856]